MASERTGVRLAPLLAIVIATASSSAWGAASSIDERELEARRDFGEAKYADALHLFVDLYAQTGDPVYLRNLARCYQKMDRPSEAIANFRDYLDKGVVSAKERREISSYIREMEALQETQRAAPTAIVNPVPQARAPDASRGSERSEKTAPAPSPLTLTSAPPSPSGSDANGRRWKRAGIAVGVGGAALLAGGIYFGLATRDASIANGNQWLSASEPNALRNEKLQYVGYATGAVALAVGAALYWYGPREANSSTRVSARVAPWPPSLGMEARF